MIEVVGAWRFPVKSAAGDRVDRLTLTASGIVGDRAWAVTDTDGTVVSAKHPSRGGRLLQVRCSYDDPTGTTTVQVPGVAPAVAGTADADAALSRWLGRDVRLRDKVTPEVRLRRRWPDQPELVPEWEATATPGAEATTAMAGASLRGRFVDFGAVHVITGRALDRLGRELGRAVDPLRFRPNLLLDGIDDPEPGEVFEVGDVRFRVELPTPRCVIPGLAYADASADSDLLRALARQERKQVSTLGRAACFGFYVTVEQPGDVRASTM